MQRAPKQHRTPNKNFHRHSSALITVDTNALEASDAQGFNPEFKIVSSTARNLSASFSRFGFDLPVLVIAPKKTSSYTDAKMWDGKI